MRVPSSTSGGRYARLLRSSTTVSSVRMGCRGGVRAGVGNHGHQVGDADVHAGLRQQRGCLAAVVGLVVEEVQQQRDEFARETVARSEEHTSELQSLMRISYAVFCLKKKKTKLT